MGNDGSWTFSSEYRFAAVLDHHLPTASLLVAL